MFGGEISSTLDRTSCSSYCEGSLVTSPFFKSAHMSWFMRCLQPYHKGITHGWLHSYHFYTNFFATRHSCMHSQAYHSHHNTKTAATTHVRRPAHWLFHETSIQHTSFLFLELQTPSPSLCLGPSLSPFPCRPPCSISICQHIFCDTFHMFLSHLSASAADQLVAKQTLLHS